MQRAITAHPGSDLQLNALLEAGWRVVSCTPFHPSVAAGGKYDSSAFETGAVLVIVERPDSVADSSPA